MDWKRLVQFALQGSSDLEPYAILLVRVSLGLFLRNDVFTLQAVEPAKPISSFSPPIFSSYLLRFFAGMPLKDACLFGLRLSLHSSEELISLGQVLARSASNSRRMSSVVMGGDSTRCTTIDACYNTNSFVLQACPPRL